MLTSQEAIINGCPRQGNHLIDDTFVKYGNDSLFEEAKTQEYVFNLARGDPKAPRVPEVLDVFPGAGGSAYLVMRRVSAPSLRSWVEQDGLSDEERQRRFDVAVDRTTAAITWLLSVKLPPGTPIGPIGGGLLHHVIFRMEEAPLNFKHTLAIERYLNEAGPWISIADDPLVLGHSDINLDNLLYNPDTDEFWMVDYGHERRAPVCEGSC
ncbi:hypothetical protein FRB99_001672 [Tulasnella sp. 403]|nr:hypothetical protein FRB99_001672 [Tulasnella sp. 403]